MKGKFIYLTLGLLLPLLSSCVFDEVTAPVENTEDVRFTFTLDVKSSSAATKADDYTWNDEFPQMIGNSLEDKIDISSLYIMAYHEDFSFATDLPILLADETGGKVTFTCALPENVAFVPGKSIRIMVIANCTSKSYGISYKNNEPALGELVYSTPIQTTIPMWGIKSFTFPASAPEDNTLDLGSVSMLRATAKIGVKLSQKLKDEGYTLKEIKLNYANSNGYSVPERWRHADTRFTESLVHDQAFRPVANSLITDINAMTRGAQTDGFYIYVPETENKTSDELSLAVTLGNGNGDEFEFDYADGIKFCNYSDGKPTNDRFNIVRNHFYDYTITDISVGLKLNLNVADWEAEDVWELDFSAPVHTKLMTYHSDGAAAPTDEPVVRYSSLDDELGAFVGYFKMESPQGVTWKPTLSNASAGDYEVRVYCDGDTNPGQYDVLVTESSIEASAGSFFKIVVVAKNPNLVGKVVKLGISYTASWNDEDNTLLMINSGDNAGLYYPWTDNDPDDDKDDPDAHWISVKQVSAN